MSGRRFSSPGRVLAAALLAVCCASGTAAAAGAVAASQPVEGYVLSIEGGDVIVDLGARRGVVEGDVLELWRPIELVHPVTRKPVRDRYRVGALRITQVRERLAVTVVEGQPKRPPQAGDSVILRRSVPEPEAPAAPGRAAPGAGPPPTDAEAQRVAALFDSLKEASLVDRIRAYIAYVRKNPQSPYARVLHADAIEYHRLLRAMRERTGAPSPVPAAPLSAAPALPPVPSTAEFEPPPHALPGKSFDLGIHLSAPMGGAVLQLRAPGDVGYRPFPMAAAGGGHFTITIPGDRMRPPSVEYFIEGIDPSGRSTRVEGSEDQPFTIEIDRDPESAPPTLQTRTTVALATDYAVYDARPGKHDDWAVQTEGMLGMRFRDVGVRALRTGFGVYRGVGGSLHELDDLNLAPRSVGLTYGYLEGELAFLPTFAIIVRAVSGLTEEGVTGGAMGLVRIGNDLGTNLAIGGEILGGVGTRSITQLEIKSLPRIPILLRSEVTNQPAGAVIGARAGTSQEAGEVGLRLIAQAGYEIWPGFVLSLRGSSQGRTIYHYGFGFGGAMSYTW